MMTPLSSNLALAPTPPANNSTALQLFENGEVHDWYKIVLGYSDKLVASLLDEFKIGAGSLVLDPFCGTGTTLVECKKRGINSIGVDANPSSCFASRVKVDWTTNTNALRSAIDQVEGHYDQIIEGRKPYKKDPTFVYLDEAGLIDRGWISPKPLRKCIALKQAINAALVSQTVRSCLLLALVAEVVKGASNVKFGPELYCGKPQLDYDLMAGFRSRILVMASDLDKASLCSPASSYVMHGDSRNLSCINAEMPQVDAIITSPPYPTEHDYTRNARLELAFLEHVTSTETLRTIKRGMMRSHTKGIYKGDNDSSQVSNVEEIEVIAKEIERAIVGKTSGFAKLYPKVMREYFGGMKLHFEAAYPLLKSNGMAAYVVGDQASYERVNIPTAELLEKLAIEVGFESLGIREWRSRWSSATSKYMAENILILRKPKDGPSPS